MSRFVSIKASFNNSIHDLYIDLFSPNLIHPHLLSYYLGYRQQRSTTTAEVVQKRYQNCWCLRQREQTNGAFYKYNLKLHDSNIFIFSNFSAKCLNVLTINNFFLYQRNKRYPTRNNNIIVPFVSTSRSQTNVNYLDQRLITNFQTM